jgi:hypothetical protein
MSKPMNGTIDMTIAMSAVAAPTPGAVYIRGVWDIYGVSTKYSLTRDCCLPYSKMDHRGGHFNTTLNQNATESGPGSEWIIHPCGIITDTTMRQYLTVAQGDMLVWDTVPADGSWTNDKYAKWIFVPKAPPLPSLWCEKQSNGQYHLKNDEGKECMKDWTGTVQPMSEATCNAAVAAKVDNRNADPNGTCNAGWGPGNYVTALWTPPRGAGPYGMQCVKDGGSYIIKQDGMTCYNLYGSAINRYSAYDCNATLQGMQEKTVYPVEVCYWK